MTDFYDDDYDDLDSDSDEELDGGDGDGDDSGNGESWGATPAPRAPQISRKRVRTPVEMPTKYRKPSTNVDMTDIPWSVHYTHWIGFHIQMIPNFVFLKRHLPSIPENECKKFWRTLQITCMVI